MDTATFQWGRALNNDNIFDLIKRRWGIVFKENRQSNHRIENANDAIDITVSTVVLNCCKGDKPSQWEYPIFAPLWLENPLTDFDEICYQ